MICCQTKKARNWYTINATMQQPLRPYASKNAQLKYQISIMEADGSKGCFCISDLAAIFSYFFMYGSVPSTVLAKRLVLSRKASMSQPTLS